jgi:hypothetical protein
LNSRALVVDTCTITREPVDIRARLQRRSRVQHHAGQRGAEA